MSELFGIDFKALTGDVFGGQLESAVVHVATETVAAQGNTVLVYVDTPAEGLLAQWKSEVMAKRGYPKDAAKIMLLQAKSPKPTNKDEITIQNRRFRIVDVREGAGNATWSLAAVELT